MRAFAFHGTFDGDAVREDIASGKFDGEDNWGAVDGNGMLFSTMKVNPYEMWFDGAVVPMAGIGAVTSAPEYRRGGHIRNIFKALFEDLRERGVVFSHLYPFSFAYYRQFGYEAVGAAARYTLPVPKARQYACDGRIAEFLPGMSERAELIEIYGRYASGYNNMIKRDAKRWDEVLKLDDTKNERIYCWQNRAGVIRSWVKFALQSQDGLLLVSQYAWDGEDGLLGLLNIFSAFDGNGKNVEISAPSDFAPELFWTDFHSINVKLRSMGMNRVVDVQKGLELLKKPERANSVIIKVSDGFAPWNNKSFQLTYDGSGSEVRESGAAPDLEVNERALLQLMIGYRGFDALTVRGDIAVNGKREALKELFPAKRINIADHF